MMPTITVTATAGQAASVQHDVGKALNLGRDATLAEIAQYLRDNLEALHRQITINEANAALVLTPLNLT
jgi:hypothetical protein